MCELKIPMQGGAKRLMDLQNTNRKQNVTRDCKNFNFALSPL